MESNNFQTSFIPKSNLDSSRVKVKTPYNLLSIISNIIISITILASLAVFGYNFFLDRQIESKKMVLTDKEKNFNYDLVSELVRFDNKLKVANTLLSKHVATSKFFTTLEESTIKKLQFSDFSYKYENPQSIIVTMNGVAESFEVVAKQAEIFSSLESTKEFFIQPVFSDLNVDEEGDIVFSFITNLNPTVLSYKNSI